MLVLLKTFRDLSFCMIPLTMQSNINGTFFLAEWHLFFSNKCKLNELNGTFDFISIHPVKVYQEIPWRVYKVLQLCDFLRFNSYKHLCKNRVRNFYRIIVSSIFVNYDIFWYTSIFIKCYSMLPVIVSTEY